MKVNTDTAIVDGQKEPLHPCRQCTTISTMRYKVEGVNTLKFLLFQSNRDDITPVLKCSHVTGEKLF